MMMKKNLFVLMISTFVLTNVQTSYAMELCENEDNSSSQEPRKKRWTPQGPMTSERLADWEKKIEKNPSKYAEYKVLGFDLWRLE